MENTCYVIYLSGSAVHNNMSIRGVLSNINDDIIIRNQIKEQYQIEFEELASRQTSSYWVFNNITDDKDVKLVIEKTTQY